MQCRLSSKFDFVENTTGMNQEIEIQQENTPSRKIQLVEFMVFVFLFLPSIVLSYFENTLNEDSFILTACAVIFHNISLVGLILFFLWRNGESVRRIGWIPVGFAHEIWIGLILFIPFSVIIQLVGNLFLSLGLSAPPDSLPSFLAAQGPIEMALALVLVTVVAIGEETIYRGYLILRLQALMERNWVSLVISSVIFAAGHGYEGSAGMATVAVMGLAFAVVYLWRGNLIAPIVMHFLQDFIGIILLPLLGD
jgi:membrane protease YdiL (CAAX protease family)